MTKKEPRNYGGQPRSTFGGTQILSVDGPPACRRVRQPLPVPRSFRIDSVTIGEGWLPSAVSGDGKRRNFEDLPRSEFAASQTSGRSRDPDDFFRSRSGYERGDFMARQTSRRDRDADAFLRDPTGHGSTKERSPYSPDPFDVYGCERGYGLNACKDHVAGRRLVRDIGRITDQDEDHWGSRIVIPEDLISQLSFAGSHRSSTRTRQGGAGRMTVRNGSKSEAESWCGSYDDGDHDADDDDDEDDDDMSACEGYEEYDEVRGYNTVVRKPRRAWEERVFDDSSRY